MIHCTVFGVNQTQHSSGGMMIWDCFTATEPEHLADIESTMTSSVYSRVKCKDVTDKAQQKLSDDTGQRS